MKKLAFVIPYYKIMFFEKTLESLYKQTNKNFIVYISDDNSPNNPKKIIDKYQNKINIVYKKFSQNLGKKNLVHHWNRSLSLLQDEEWVCVLPDDDIISENFVEEFYSNLSLIKKTNIKVIRSSLYFLEGKNHIIKKIDKNIKIIENIYNFYLKLLKGETGSSLGENIFDVKKLREIGGFIDFPKGWGSDHATILKVAEKGKILTLKNSKFYFRMSGINISSQKDDGKLKLEARLLFAEWLKKNQGIFNKNLNSEFCRYFIFKAEYYILNEWKFNFKLLINLYKLHKVCGNKNFKSLLNTIKFSVRNFRNLKNNYLI